MKVEAMEYFEKRFKETVDSKVKLWNVEFERIWKVGNEMVIEEFTKEEIKGHIRLWWK